jgi:hypothetical protein
MALCKLHNFCIGAEDSLEIFTESNESVPSRDELPIVNNGDVELESGCLLLGGGQHFDDVTCDKRGYG